MRRLTAAVAVLVLLVLSSGAAAFTLAEWERYGYAVPAYDARALAMGGAGLAAADGARGLGFNPALLAKAKGVDVAVTGLVVLAEESRQTPLHDSFDGVIGYNTYAMNSGVYDRYSGSIAYRPELKLEMMPTIGIGYGTRIDMSYTYHVQYRDPDFQTEPADKVLYDYYVEGEGGVDALSVGLGQEVANDVYVGIGVDFLVGEHDVDERWVYPVDSEEEDAHSWARYKDMSGVRFTLGLQVETLHRLDVALVYRSGFDLEGDYMVRAASDTASSSGNFEHKYPGTLALGLRYRPRNELMTIVTCDVEYTRWSDFEDSMLDEDPELSDVVNYRLGVEHEFFDDTFARFGFAYGPSYADDGVTTSAFSAGLGLDVLGVRVDIGGQVGLREYDIEDGRVRETTTLAMATVTHSF
jgi:hypothetical protein